MKRQTAARHPAGEQAPRRPRFSKTEAAQAARSTPVRVAAAERSGGSARGAPHASQSGKGLRDYVRQVTRATPLELVAIERRGVLGSLIKDLSRSMEIPSSRMFAILGIPKATAEKKAAAGERVEGRGGQAAIGLVKLVGIAQDIVANSTAPEARSFDVPKWLGEWIERPQPALGGLKPSELIDTPSGVELVARLLGSLQSGAYQ